MSEGGNKLRTACRTSLSRGTGGCRAGSMTLRGNLLIRRIIATGAGIVSVPADLRTSRRLRLMMLEVMPESCFQLCTAHTAGLCCRTGSRRAGDMTLCRRDDGAAHRTNLIFRTRCIGAKRMALCRNALCPFFVTAAARRSLYAFFRASGRLCLHILTPIMPEGGNFLLRFNDHVTATAMDAFGFPRRSTRCRYRLIDDFYMIESFDVPRLRFPAARAFGRLDAVLRAGGSFRLRVFAPIMTESGNFLLCLDDRITTGTMRTVRQTRLRTCRRNGGIGHGNMPERRNRSCRFSAASAARCLFLAQRRTGRVLCLTIRTVIMPELRNDLLRFEHLTTNTAMTAFRRTVFRTRCRYGGICYNSMAACHVKYDAANGTSLRRYASRRRTGRMTFRRNTLRAFFVATGTRRSLYAFFRAGGGFRLRVFTPNMAERGNRLLRLDDGVTAAAMNAFGFPRRRTRRRNCRIRHRAVPQRRKRPRRRGAAARASCRLRARRRTRRQFGRRITAVVMPKCGICCIIHRHGASSASPISRTT